MLVYINRIYGYDCTKLFMFYLQYVIMNVLFNIIAFKIKFTRFKIKTLFIYMKRLINSPPTSQ